MQRKLISVRRSRMLNRSSWDVRSESGSSGETLETWRIRLFQQPTYEKGYLVYINIVTLKSERTTMKKRC